jgi:transposase-like protein
MERLAPPKPCCPKCGARMPYVASTPHPQSPQMKRTTFICFTCNRTWSYVLLEDLAKQYEAGAQDSAERLSRLKQNGPITPQPSPA